MTGVSSHRTPKPAQGLEGPPWSELRSSGEQSGSCGPGSPSLGSPAGPPPRGARSPRQPSVSRKAKVSEHMGGRRGAERQRQHTRDARAQWTQEARTGQQLEGPGERGGGRHGAGPWEAGAQGAGPVQAEPLLGQGPARQPQEDAVSSCFIKPLLCATT